MDTPRQPPGHPPPGTERVDSPWFRYGVDGSIGDFALRGDWTLPNLAELVRQVEALKLDAATLRAVTFHCGGLEDFDLSGAWLLHSTSESLKARGVSTEFAGFRVEHLDYLEQLLSDRPAAEQASPRALQERLYLGTTAFITLLLTELRNRSRWFLAVTSGLLAALMSPRRFRWMATFRHIQDAGVSALGIVVLMAFLVAVVLSFQSQDQLVQFGAQIFTVDLVSISVLREMGGLLTAVLVAGRSGSAFAAEIGVMQLNEEISAMRTMGVDPFQALVIPRMAALVLCLPLLTFLADLSGLLGLLFIASGMLDIPASLVVERFLALDPLTHFRVGLIKAPFFALVIGAIGTYRGYYVEHSADAVGRNTTSAVVESIFMVIALDALFSVIFTELEQ